MRTRRPDGAGAALVRLRAAFDDGRLDAACARHDVRLVVLFGSGATPAEDPSDIDLGYLPGPATDALAFLDEIVTMVRDDRIDLVDLDRAGSTLRHRAFSGIGLYEDQPGLFARRRDLALRQYADTVHVRRASAEALTRR